MSANNMLGTILIRENTPLPAGFALENRSRFPGWRAVRNLDGYELGRKVVGDLELLLSYRSDPNNRFLEAMDKKLYAKQ